ncbi:lipopolysaccharide heptosyltransferase II [Candidatus Magnetominusculus xianensis]|uniref:lipopolysaccharide heptosyltransferase II n=1 Tax=Candidatus Magnetominusculus xianensis TaxID=1748249 RepID=A0ABR5SJ55_9BACT|nr:lipopolysaccharide heptosyltransferase II [Candidatus Magnetominusculus xianensis]KWT85565.1 ADP-heptose--LPS heptosyltransferase II [Candidatus Magnetominusculus xianensis]MBF0404204.1 lipopolysaccharide heptosyltransferase II [Nitrospirota bacterium]
MPEPENILIRGVNWIGDAVMTAPALRAIKGAYPEGSTTLLVNPAVAGLFEKDPHVGAIIEYKDRTIAGRLRLSKTLKAKNFTTAILLQNAFDAALITWLARIGQRIGYKRDARGFLLTNGIALTGDTLRLHHCRYYLNMLTMAGINAPYRLPWIYLTTAERQSALDVLAHLKRPVIGINPGAAFGLAKRWPTERFANVIERIVTEKAGSAVLFGSPKDVEISAAIRRHINPDVLAAEETFLDLTGKTGIRELCGRIAGCDMLITNDSGPMHIAYATGTPVIAIFGSTSPELTGPPGVGLDSELEFSAGHKVIRKQLACTPCFKRVCPHGHLNCMNDISAAEVFDEIDAMLGRKKAVFFDRDGTLCEDAHYLNSFSDFRPYDGLDRLAALKDKGYMLIGQSNQSGIGRGIVDEGFVKALHRVFIDKYGFDDFYYCKHVPADNCACRKPSPGMLLRARAEHAVDLKNSIFIGDKNVDMETALAVGATPIFFKTKKHALSIPGIRQISALDELHTIVGQ